RKSSCPAQPGEVIVSSRNPNGAAGITPHSCGSESRGDGRTGAAARPSRVATKIVGIPGLSSARADCRDPGGEFVHIRFSDNDSPGILQAPHLKRISAWMKR